jgi:peroxiredoxin
MTTARRAIAIGVGAAVLTSSACGGSDSSGESEMLPDVELVGVGETAVNTSSWVGEPLVINFWFSTCIPCATELVDFAEVDEARGDEVRFVGVNPIDTPEAMVEFAGERGVTYDLFRDEFAELQEELRVAQFPATYFVASDGTIVDSTGVLDAESLNRNIDELLTADENAQETTT